MSTGGLIVGPGRHEAARHAQPARARDRRRGDEGVDRVVQGAHRRDRRPAMGVVAETMTALVLAVRGAAQVRRRLAGRGACATATATWPHCARPAVVGRARPAVAEHVAARGDDGRRASRRWRGWSPTASGGRGSTPTPRWRGPRRDGAPRSSPDTGRPASGAEESPCSPRRSPRTARRRSRSGGGAVLDPANRARRCARRAPWCGCGPGPRPCSPGARRCRRPLLGGPTRRQGRAEALRRIEAERRPLYAEVADDVVDVDDARPRRWPTRASPSPVQAGDVRPTDEARP